MIDLKTIISFHKIKFQGKMQLDIDNNLKSKFH